MSYQTDESQFGNESDTASPCEVCEAMCLDAVDGTLTPAELAMFDRHMAGCVGCAEQLSEAKRGAAWMEMLKGHRPEPPAGMLQRILAQTSEAEMSRVFPRQGVPTPRFDVVPVAGQREKFWGRLTATFTIAPGQSYFQPRMAMTAAMAFFSIALTLNLSGVRLGDLRPSAIQRSVADVRASAARTFQNMRVVYQVESRVNELRDRDPRGLFGGESEPAKVTAPVPVPEEKVKPQPTPETPRGTSELVLPKPRLQRVSNKKIEQQTAPDADAPRVQRGA